ncbi:Vesicle-associated membrane protein 3 [Clonorchis sinensis]|uniref:Vesicle-associated membrane protein 3 n=1 Tax=Clonorchis sinensis TaxID=79923 RepID=A0A8T1LY84_CLOSI|nr:Vesicle-associated membrane protein 3 [Clonorchis sinensis]
MSTEGGNPEAADGGVAPSRPQNKRLQQTQAQVDEVVDIMRVNMEKVLERDAKLSQLDDRADALQAGASQFEASAGKLKNKYWWKNMKMNIIIGAVVLVVVVALGWYIFGGKKSEERAPAVTPQQVTLPAATVPAAVPPAAAMHARKRRWTDAVHPKLLHSMEDAFPRPIRISPGL